MKKKIKMYFDQSGLNICPEKQPCFGYGILCISELGLGCVTNGISDNTPWKEVFADWVMKDASYSARIFHEKSRKYVSINPSPEDQKIMEDFLDSLFKFYEMSKRDKAVFLAYCKENAINYNFPEKRRTPKFAFAAEYSKTEESEISVSEQNSKSDPVGTLVSP